MEYFSLLLFHKSPMEKFNPVLIYHYLEEKKKKNTKTDFPVRIIKVIFFIS